MANKNLQQCLKDLGRCSKAIVNTTPTPLTPAHAELRIGVGTCSDWIAWASQLQSLQFKSKIKRNSLRSLSYLESTRFTYAWTAANALFSRDQIATRLGATQAANEFDRFLALHTAAALAPSESGPLLHEFHSFLDTPRKPKEFPWSTSSHIRIIDVIYYKYTPTKYRNFGVAGKAIRDVVCGGRPTTSLDLPTIIYSIRNWTIHGVLLNSSFRGSPKQFQKFILAANDALALIVGRAARVLESRL